MWYFSGDNPPSTSADNKYHEPDIDVINKSLDNDPLSDNKDNNYYDCDDTYEDEDITVGITDSECSNNLKIINSAIPKFSLLSTNEREGFISDLRHWAIKYKICLNAISNLFWILRKQFHFYLFCLMILEHF